MSTSHLSPLIGNNPNVSRFAMFILPLFTLIGCAPNYTPDQRARIAELATEFQTVCDRGNECERAQDINCDFTDYSRHDQKVMDPADAQAERDCENDREKRVAQNCVPGRSIYEIVAERNSLGLTQWQGASWTCSSYLDAHSDSKGVTEAGAYIDNGRWY